MRKFIFALLALAFVASMASLTSCKHVPADKEAYDISGKIYDGEFVTNEEYESLINYFEAAFDDMRPLLEEYKEAAKVHDYSKIADLEYELRKKDENYMYVGRAIDALDRCDEAEMGAKNYSRFHKLKNELESLQAGC